MYDPLNNCSSVIAETEKKILRLNNMKAKKLIGWKPKWGLNTSLNKILEWNNKIKVNKPLNVCRTQIKEFLKL